MSHLGDSDWPEGEAATHHDQENQKIVQLKRRGSSPDPEHAVRREVDDESSQTL